MTETDLFDLDLSRLADLTEADLTNAITGLIGEPTMLRARAVAQHREAVKLLRQADHLELMQQLTKGVAKIETALTAADSHAATCADSVDQLTVRDAEARDRVLDAEQHHGELARQHESYVQLNAKASRLSESLARLNAARSILDGAQAEAWHTNNALVNAQQSLTDARTEAAQLRAGLDAAKALVEQAEANPDATPRTLPTLVMDWPTMMNPTKLTPKEQSLVRGLVAMISHAIGADTAALQAGRDATLAEAQHKVDRARALTPAEGSVTYYPPGIG